MAGLSVYEPADIEIRVRKKELVLREKSLIALAKADSKILAVGNEAAAIAESNMADVRVFSPLRRGQIADFSAASAMFRCMMQRVRGKRSFRRPHIAVCVPDGMTEVEKKALEDVLYVSSGGIKELTIYEGALGEFMEGMQQHQPKQYAKYDILIGIGKEAPEKYIAEEFSDILDYAGRQGISGAGVGALLGFDAGQGYIGGQEKGGAYDRPGSISALIEDNDKAANNSFLYSLHERNMFDTEAFTKLLDCINALEPGSKEALICLNHIQSEILKHVIYHFDPGDMSHIGNLPENYWEYLSRLEESIRRYIEG